MGGANYAKEFKTYAEAKKALLKLLPKNDEEVMHKTGLFFEYAGIKEEYDLKMKTWVWVVYARWSK